MSRKGQMAVLYSNLKIFHFGLKSKDILEGKISAPIHIRIKPTNRCNHQCFYCCYRNDSLYLSELMNENDAIPQKKMEEIVDDLRDMGVKAVTFSGGGEPLLYPFIIEAIEELLNAGIKVGILTNGSLLNGERAEVLARRVSWVRISMDAVDPQSYAKIRGVRVKEFDIVCNNIANFAGLRQKRCELGISFIVSKYNYSDIFKFLMLMKELGVDHVKVCECVTSVEGEENKSILSPLANHVKEQIAEGISKLASDDFSIIDRFDDFKEDNNYKKRYSSCPFIQCMTIIGADMNVYACQDKAYTNSGILGSIRDKSFQELWYSDETKKRLLGLNPANECRHHCTQHNKNIMLLDYMNINRSHVEFV